MAFQTIGLTVFFILLTGMFAELQAPHMAAACGIAGIIIFLTLLFVDEKKP